MKVQTNYYSRINVCRTQRNAQFVHDGACEASRMLDPTHVCCLCLHMMRHIGAIDVHVATHNTEVQYNCPEVIAVPSPHHVG